MNSLPCSHIVYLNFPISQRGHRIPCDPSPFQFRLSDETPGHQPQVHPLDDFAANLTFLASAANFVVFAVVLASFSLLALFKIMIIPPFLFYELESKGFAPMMLTDFFAFHAPEILKYSKSAHFSTKNGYFLIFYESQSHAFSCKHEMHDLLTLASYINSH